MRFDMRCVSHPQAAEKKRVLDIKKGEAEGAVLTAQAKVRMSSAHTINGFGLAGNLPGGVVMLKWPAACLIRVRQHLHDGPNWYVTSHSLDVRLEILFRHLLELMLAPRLDASLLASPNSQSFHLLGPGPP